MLPLGKVSRIAAGTAVFDAPVRPQPFDCAAAGYSRDEPDGAAGRRFGGRPVRASDITEESEMYIGGGVIVLIVVVILILLLVRR